MRIRSFLVATASAALLIPATRSPAQLPFTPALQQKLDSFRLAQRFPGATLGVALRDGSVLELATGFSDTARKLAMRPTDRLLQGSVGKTYVSAVALQLIHEGKLSLDDKISKFFGTEPWFARLPNGADITVRQLMTHTSGLVRYEFQPKFTADLRAQPMKVWTPEERLSYILGSPPPFAAGAGWEYSDTNYIVLGMIIERLTGNSYYAELRRRILDPLVLRNTIPSDRPDLPGIANGYAGPSNELGGYDASLVAGRLAVNPGLEWTGGGIASTAGDLARWARLLYEGKAFHPSLLPRLLDGVPARLGREARYGLGVIIRPTALGTSYGHSGFFPGYATEMLYFPNAGVAVAVQINATAPYPRGMVPFAVEVARTVSQAARASNASSNAVGTTVSNPIVDSASAARAHWASANAALAAHDTVGAYRHATRAATAWPTQPTYVWGRAVTAALAGDTAAAREALTAYAALGLGRDIRADPRFRTIVADGRLTSLVEQLAANQQSIGNSRVAFQLADSTLWPEGIDYDPRTGRFYITSVRHRTIVERLANGATRELIPRFTSGIGAILAVRVDTARNVLWATSSGLPQMVNYSPSDSSHGAILRISLRDGVIERWNLPGGGRHVLGDIAVAPNGDVYVTDSAQPLLYRFRPADGAIERISSPLFHSLQGIAVRVDPQFGVVLHLADYSHGLLFIHTASGAIGRVQDAPQSTALGIDGLVADGGALIAIQNGVAPARVMRFQLDSAGTTVTRVELLDRNSAMADEPTAGVIVGRRFLYIANSQWEKYDAAGNRRTSAPLRRPLVLELPLGGRR
jgi:D-alanyl-D-alanine carboxypeptidase